MSLKKAAFAICALVAASGGLVSAIPNPNGSYSGPRAVGEIIYEEGEVTIHRGREVLRGKDADIGVQILSYDLVTTGPGSRVEVDLASAAAGGAIVKVSERTSFYFDTATPGDGSRKTTIRLLSGSILCKVEKLAGGSFSISSGHAALGVRGTTFAVDYSAEGSVLVSCVEGQVACTGSDGSEYRAAPGSLVEADPDGSLSSREVPVEKLLANRSSWLYAKASSIENNGASIFLDASKELAAARPAFSVAMERFDSEAPTLASWEELLAQGKSFGPTERLSERKALSQSLLVCLRALPGLERPFYRLADLAKRDEDGKKLGGSFSDLKRLGPALQEFRAGAERDELSLARIRRALFVFSRMEGDSPLGQFFAEKAEILGMPSGF
jgi:hypothetical protein